jgi:hypothetical protein
MQHASLKGDKKHLELKSRGIQPAIKLFKGTFLQNSLHFQEAKKSRFIIWVRPKTISGRDVPSSLNDDFGGLYST